jgi:hypothetical protein
VGEKLKKIVVFILLLVTCAFLSTILVRINISQKVRAASITFNKQQAQVNNRMLLKRKAAVLNATIKPVMTQTIVTIPPTPTPTPIKPNLRVGIALTDYQNTNGDLSSILLKLDKPISVISIYKQFGLPVNKDFIADDLSFAKAKGMTVNIAWEPWNPELGMQQSQDYLDLIPKGNYDAYIKSFAQAIKDYQNPVMIRFGHEMNGDWYPWGQRPGEYIKAYRYLVSKFRQIGVENVNFMWSINSDNVPYTDIKNAAEYYPGDDVVDIIGIDGFNFGLAEQSSTWRSFKDIFLPAYQFASTYQKPISISETASSEEGGNKAEWISQMFTDLKTVFPKVTDLVWFDILKEADWRIDSSISSLQAFKSGI